MVYQNFAEMPDGPSGSYKSPKSAQHNHPYGSSGGSAMRGGMGGGLGGGMGAMGQSMGRPGSMGGMGGQGFNGHGGGMGGPESTGSGSYRQTSTGGRKKRSTAPGLLFLAFLGWGTISRCFGSQEGDEE